jgi:hypothetical protein
MNEDNKCATCQGDDCNCADNNATPAPAEGATPEASESQTEGEASE